MEESGYDFCFEAVIVTAAAVMTIRKILFFFLAEGGNANVAEAKKGTKTLSTERQ